MPKLIITGVPPYDGEYKVAPLTLRDASTIKKISGVRAGELSEALSAGDTDVLVAVAVVTLQRSGFPEATADALWDTEGGAILVEPDEDEEDAGRPPAEATTGGEQNSSAVVAEQNDPSEPSGATGTEDGENSPGTPPDTGSPGSGMPADFGQPI